jgi:hypothetical protein
MTITRSQDRLARELCVSDRHVRTGLAHWKRCGVLRVLKHGGGTSRKPSQYGINLEKLKLHALQLSDSEAWTAPTTPEVHEFHLAENDPLQRNSMSSGVSAITPEVLGVPQLHGHSESSGVQPTLRNKTANCDSHSGRLGVPGTQRSESEKKTDMASAQSHAPVAPRARPAGPTGQRARIEPSSAEEIARRRQAAADLVERETRKAPQ